MTPQLLDGLAHLPELIELVAEAAQELLEAREEADREAISQARKRLLDVLDDSAELAVAIDRLLALIRFRTSPRRAEAESDDLTPPDPAHTVPPNLTAGDFIRGQ